jgi:hypothetical protein
MAAFDRAVDAAYYQGESRMKGVDLVKLSRARYWESVGLRG